MDLELVKKLRDETGLSITECKKALEESGADMQKARLILAKKASAVLEKKADRDLGAGVVEAYIHNTKNVGAMVELLCETDFVARNEDFQKTAYEIAMHASAMKPQFVSREEIPEDKIAEIKEKLKEEVADKPTDMQEKILEGKLDSQLKDYILLEQKFIKDDSKTIKNLVEEAAQKFGEKVELGRFSVFSV